MDIHHSAMTGYNSQQVLQSHKDTPLSDTGHQQAELVAERMKREKFDFVFSSDLQRAKKVDKTPNSCPLKLFTHLTGGQNLIEACLTNESSETTIKCCFL